MLSSTHLLVANSRAQSGRNAKRIDRALRALEKHGICAELVPTLPNGQTVAAVRDALRQGACQCIISMGGDGTLREVAQAIMDCGWQRRVKLAMLPAGTANNHGRSFDLDTSERALEKNVAIIAKGHETQLDVGRLDMHDETGQTVVRAVFIDSVGFGIGARVIARRHAERRRFGENTLLAKVYRDKRVYTVATLQALRSASKQDNFGVTIVTDGQTRTYPQLTELLIKGTRVYAGSWIIDRTSRHDDGLFEVVAYPDNRRWVAKGLVDVLGSEIVKSALNGAGFSLPEPWRASRMQLHFDVSPGVSLPAVQVDGELFPVAEHVTIEVVPRALRLVVP
jgi:diacylglycerol kinase family enzyme